MLQILIALALGLLPVQQARPEMSLEEKRLATIPKDFLNVEKALSPDGRTLAFGGNFANGTSALFVGDRRLNVEPSGQPAWSPDSSRLACPVKVEEKFGITIDGARHGALYDGVGRPAFSPDGKRLAYPAMIGEKWHMIVGDSKGEAFDEVDDPVWSPDGKRLAYRAQNGDLTHYVIDGKKSEGYVGDKYPPVFSPEGRVAYIAVKTRDDQSFFVLFIEGRPLLELRNQDKEPYETALGPVFGNSTDDVAWVVGGSESVLFRSGKKAVSGKDFYSLPAISRDGRLAYKVKLEDKTHVVVDGKEGEAFPFMFPDPPIWSPDGKRVAYIGGSATVSPMVVVVGERKSPEFADVTLGGFSPDGKKFAFCAQVGDDYWWKVME
jgi:hypothetical protein